VLLRLRRSRKELPQLAEEDVYARSYGERSDDVTNVMPRQPDEPEPVQVPRLSDRSIRDAFRVRLERRGDG
jgi:DNA-directed RNA polymerase subunit H (RpoH/RPB5)